MLKPNEVLKLELAILGNILWDASNPNIIRREPRKIHTLILALACLATLLLAAA